MTTESNRTNDESQIHSLRENLTNALRAKDANGVVSHFAAETVMFVLAPPLQYKTGENAPGSKGIQEWFDSFSGAIGYEVRELQITAGETVAFCHSLNRISGTKSDGGEKTDIWIRETLGLRKIEGDWKIAHQHQSVPFYMDSIKAAIDLKP
jgi:ketosteroid isomerase-like protein